MKVTVTVEGKPVLIEQGKPILEALRQLDIFIPTLCYHEALEGYGACRLCMVEVIKKKKSQLVTSCNYPVEEGLEVFPNSRKAVEIRKKIMELLLARCPDVPLIQGLASNLEVVGSPFKKREDKKCVLCGLCVRVCQEVVGVNAIGLSDRGIYREVATPFHKVSDICIGCGACSYICPTGCIEMVKSERSLDGRTLRIVPSGMMPECSKGYRCETCPVDEGFLGRIKTAIGTFRESLHERART